MAYELFEERFKRHLPPSVSITSYWLSAALARAFKNAGIETVAFFYVPVFRLGPVPLHPQKVLISLWEYLRQPKTHPGASRQLLSVDLVCLPRSGGYQAVRPRRF
jgi:hypothetical protein